MSLKLRNSLVAGALVAGAFGFVGFMAPTAAHAQEFVSASVDNVDEERNVPNEVLNENIQNTQSPQVLAETAERGLAFTGTDAIGLGALGAASIAIGATALAARRRNANANA